jgi:hypothetical protein
VCYGGASARLHADRPEGGLSGQAAGVSCGSFVDPAERVASPTSRCLENPSVGVGIRVPLCRLALPRVDENGQRRDEGGISDTPRERRALARLLGQCGER